MISIWTQTHRSPGHTVTPRPKVTQPDGKPDTFSITSRGRLALQVTQSLTSPSLLVRFRLHKAERNNDFSEFCQFEAMLELARRGWTYEQRSASKKIPGYTKNSVKKWFWNKQICKHYVRALLSVDQLFALGLQELVHFQASAYYKTLLIMLKKKSTKMADLLPRQPLSYYKLFQKRLNPGRHPRAAAMDEFETEDQGLAGGRQILSSNEIAKKQTIKLNQSINQSIIELTDWLVDSMSA